MGVWSVIGVVGLLISACGGDDSSPGDTSGGGGSGATSGTGGAGGAGGTSGGGGSSGSSGAGGAGGTSGTGGAGGASGTGGAPADAGTDSPSDASTTDSGDAGCLAPALHFVTVNDSVALPAAAALKLGAQGTVEAWVYRGPAGGGRVFNDWVGWKEDKFLNVTTSGGLHAGFFLTGGGLVELGSAAGAVAPSSWKHVAFSYDASGARGYVDGVPVASIVSTGDPADESSTAYIGGIFRDGKQEGLVDTWVAELRISAVARYTAAFKPAATLGSDANTLGYWPLSEGVGVVANDASGNGVTGTITGATWGKLPCR
ncbi:MAG: LamG domain-containing protein [Polyangiaceae bacterium]|nr:LamG domain-containing protein [Polyangiaceae bacterium]